MISAYVQSDIYMKEIAPIAPLSEAEEKRMFRLVAKGDEEAREKVIKANLKLVVKIAKKYARLGVPFMDLVEEGNLGLIRATHKFDVKRGCRFSTYAACWIKQFIMRALANQGKTIRLPVYMVDRIGRIDHTINDLKDKFNRNPTIDEIAEEVSLSSKKVLEVFNIAKKTHSIHAMLNEDTDFLEVLEDKRAVHTEKVISSAFLQEELVDLLGHLKPREVDIITKRYGLDGGTTMTLKDIGSQYAISRERVRQIEQGALRKLEKMMKQKRIHYEDLV